jgi:hypothetical protein
MLKKSEAHRCSKRVRISDRLPMKTELLSETSTSAKELAMKTHSSESLSFLEFPEWQHEYDAVLSPKDAQALI